MPKYALVYFEFRGRAELCRLTFAAAGVDYEDVRVKFDDWPSLKEADREHKEFLFGQMPILKVDDEVIAQTYAISRYLANEFGFAGQNNLQKAKVDMIVTAVDDLYSPLVFNNWYEKDEDRKAAWFDNFKTKTLPNGLKLIQNQLEANNGGDGYFVGESLTMADLTFVDRIDLMRKFSADNVLDDFPKLKALKERVEALPKIAEWIKKRPHSDY
ncbi:hematopoietic prostaglandin D synthase-like [Glandiceps talaboti]